MDDIDDLFDCFNTVEKPEVEKQPQRNKRKLIDNDTSDLNESLKKAKVSDPEDLEDFIQTM